MFYIIILILLILTAYAWISLAPWVPTYKKDLERVNKIADLKPGDTFVEIGCGNGRVCTYIANKNPKSQVIGIELAFPFYLFTKIRTCLLGPDNLKIIFKDGLKYNINNVDVLYVYGLIKTVNNQIKNKVVKEMKKGSKLISYVFAINDWPGKSKTFKEDDKNVSIHLYYL